VADITEIQQRIDRTFYRDIFMAISRMEGVQPRNELELTKRDLERLQVLGPFIELFETEFADPILKRVIAIMERRKLLELMPESLKKKKLKISYISILSLAQRSSETVAMKDALVTGGALSSAAKAAGLPDPLRVFNLDKSMRIYAELSNYPSEAIFTEDEVKQQDAARNAAHSQAQQLSTSMAGVNAAKSLSQTPLGQNTALDALLGQGGGGGGQ
jgi:hypothetical protein